jgi:hypothetical protein
MSSEPLAKDMLNSSSGLGVTLYQGCMVVFQIEFTFLGQYWNYKNLKIER